MITLKNAYGSVVVDAYGGQVLSYVPTGGSEVLWRTGEEFLDAARANGKAMRGGIPICWPWFGPHAQGLGPQHGLARTAVWQVVRVEEARAMLAFASDGSDAGFPYKAAVEVEVLLAADGLQVALTTHNHDEVPFALSQALHSYVRVGDIGQVKVSGLAGTRDQNGVMAPEVLRFDGELDNVYAPCAQPLKVTDAVLGRTVMVANAGCEEVVVWNPWADKADATPGGWKQFVCVEAAQVHMRPTLLPGESRAISTRLRVQ